MYTIDASVHINALNPQEPGSTDSLAFLEQVYMRPLTTISPTLLLVEVAAVIARVFDDHVRGIAYAQTIRLLPKAIWVSLDDPLATEAVRLGAVHRLRGADAIYAAVTLRNQTTLITLDKQQLARLSQVIPVQKPAEALASLA